jgi:hypothetical protein
MGDSSPEANGGDPTMLAMIKGLEEEMEALKNHQQGDTSLESPSTEPLEDSQPLSETLWDAEVPAKFKIPQLSSFDGKTDLLEHLMAVGTQTAIIGASEHLKCKLLSNIFKDVALRWYMNLPKHSIENYADFHRKFLHQFAGSKHIQVTATSLFGIRQDQSEFLREYLARFSEATIKISNPNKEMFVAAFQNGLKAEQFNESLA